MTMAGLPSLAILQVVMISSTEKDQRQGRRSCLYRIIYDFLVRWAPCAPGSPAIPPPSGRPRARIMRLRHTRESGLVANNRGGTNEWSNLQSLCGPCHNRKTARESGFGHATAPR